MKEFIHRGGSRTEVIGSIDRGPIMLHDAMEWSRRYREFQSQWIMLGLIMYPLLGILCVILLYPVYGWTGTTLFAGYLGFGGFYVLMDSMGKSELLSGRPIPGIYEKGIEMPFSVYYLRRMFIPWEEVTSLEVRAVFITESLRLGVRGTNTIWRFPIDVLKEDGAELVKRLARENGAQTLPDGRLVFPEVA
jgi:hypothetical protein